VAAQDVTLRSVWQTGQDFLAAYTQAADTPPRFFHQVAQELGLPPAAVGDMVSVVLVFEDRDAEFHVHARVIDRREGTTRRGFTLEIIPEEQERVEVILVAARGESLPYRRRRYERIPHRTVCTLSDAAGRSWSGDTTNINEGGLHAAVAAPMPETGAVLTVGFEIDGRRRSLQACVVESVSAGPQRGVGVEFRFSSAAERDAWWDEVSRLRGRRRRESAAP
jgi:hypothetical protein